ncbi:MAG: hypothetical protein LBR45_01775, partial [Bacteroidales bacterium]|nr:hypothetical protein [Bacteroidales bacterium]
QRESNDSVIILHLTVNEFFSRIDSLTISADSLPYTYGDTVFDIGTSSGLHVFIFNYTAISGCDSFVHLHLKVLLAYDTIYDTICENSLPYTDNGFNVNMAGEYRRASTSNDSLITLYLTVNPSYRETKDTTINEWDLPYAYHDTVFNMGTSSGTYIFYDSTINGCDSIIILNLTIVPLALELEVLPVADLCGGEDDLTIEYQVTEGAARHISVLFDDSAHAQGVVDIDSQSTSGSSITVPLPSSIRPDSYSARIIFHNYSLSKEFSLEFNILYSSSVMQQKWNNVIALKNATFNGGYDFVDYEWYLNDEEIISQINRGSYIYTGERESLQFGQEYKALLTRRNESYSIFTCPFIPKEQVDINEYPIVVTEGENVIVFPVKSNASVSVWTLKGLPAGKVTQGDNSDRIKIPLEPGFYFIEIMEQDNRRFVEKVIIY